MLDLKKEFPARVIRATINGKQIYLVIFKRDARYIGIDFRPILLTSTERSVVCRKLAELRRGMKATEPIDLHSPAA